MTLAVFVMFLLLATAGVLAQGGDRRSFTDPCSEYCLNGGTCSDSGNGPECACPREFSGPQCEIHPGTCPVVQPDGASKCVGDPCATDAACPFGQKCCDRACGRKACTSVVTRDPCIPDPYVCKNGGTCISPFDGILCQCRSGYGGDRCENSVPVKIGTCVSDPNAGEFNCTRGCDSDFNCTGTQKCCNTQCERQCSSNIIIDPCSGFCFSGGSCSDIGNGPTCTCPRGFSGPRCEIHPGTCPALQPDGVSVCGGIECTTDAACPFGQKCCALECGGNFCTPVVTRDPCISDPYVCKNGGTCISPLDRIICQCRSGYGGPRCENSVPVKNGTCLSDPNAGEFNCTRGCDNDFNCPGTQKCCNTQCERQCTNITVFDPCRDFCLNGGTCLALADEPSCTCPRGFSGRKCEIPPDTCPKASPRKGVPCRTHSQCKAGQKCCGLRYGKKYCTPDVYPTPTPTSPPTTTPTPPQLTCLTAKCTADVVCRHVVDCLNCRFNPKCIPSSSVPSGSNSKCELGGYSDAILIQSPTNSSSYSPLICRGPAHVSTNTCPYDSVCVRRGYGSGICCRTRSES